MKEDSIIIKSKRLYLRHLVIEDAEHIFNYAKNINVSKFVTWDSHVTIKDSIKFVKSILKIYKIFPISNLGIVINENFNETVIGTIGLLQKQRMSLNTYELGFAINENYWGKGYAYEAAISLLKHCFDNYIIQRVEATCMIENIKSYKLMEKIGMKREGILRKYVFKNNYYYDSYMYSILKHEWDNFL